MRKAFRFHLRNRIFTAVSHSRPYPRHPQPRFASSSSSSNSGSSLDQAQKTAQNAYAAASKQAGNAFQAAKKAAGPVGARVGNMLGCACRLSRSLTCPSPYGTNR